jgi:hypothetical protein
MAGTSGPVAPRFHPSRNKARQMTANLIFSFLTFRMYAFATTGRSPPGVWVGASSAPRLSKFIESGRDVFSGSNESRAEILVEGSAVSVASGWEVEAATSTAGMRVIGEEGKERQQAPLCFQGWRAYI